MLCYVMSCYVMYVCICIYIYRYICSHSVSTVLVCHTPTKRKGSRFGVGGREVQKARPQGRWLKGIAEQPPLGTAGKLRAKLRASFLGSDLL